MTWYYNNPSSIQGIQQSAHKLRANTKTAPANAATDAPANVFGDPLRRLGVTVGLGLPAVLLLAAVSAPFVFCAAAVNDEPGVGVAVTMFFELELCELAGADAPLAEKVISCEVPVASGSDRLPLSLPANEVGTPAAPETVNELTGSPACAQSSSSSAENARSDVRATYG